MTTPARPHAPTAATAVRPWWAELPKPLREGLVGRLGPMASAEIQTGGFTPGLAARLRLASGERVFAKGIPADHALAGKYRAEAGTAPPRRHRHHGCAGTPTSQAGSCSPSTTSRAGTRS